MKQRLLYLLSLTPLLLSCLPGAVPAEPTSSWQPFTFNGREFQPGTVTGRQAIWTRNGYYPRMAQPAGPAIDIGRLPVGTGTVAGICYLHSSGGKLADPDAAIPCPDEQVIMRSDSQGVSVTRTDSAGYFMEALFPGLYEFRCRGAGATAVVVKEGRTSLLPIRGGKRMAD